MEGNAEKLPFADQSFDAVINVEASHCYPRFPQFLDEVARVLRPGGHFLYTDVRRRKEIATVGGAAARRPPAARGRTRLLMRKSRGGWRRSYPVMLFKQARVRAVPLLCVMGDSLSQTDQRCGQLPGLLLRQRVRRCSGRRKRLGISAMKIVLANWGTRGEVEPYVAVGRELVRRGHDVAMAVAPEMVGFTEATGPAAVAYGPDLKAILDPHRDYWTSFFGTPWRIQELNRLLREVSEPLRREPRRGQPDADVAGGRSRPID